MEERGSVNLVAFVKNQPMASYDPLGLTANGIISIGEIPGIAEPLSQLHARLLNKGISITSASVSEAQFTPWLTQIGPSVFLTLYSQAIYDVLQTEAENAIRNIAACYLINLDAVSEGGNKTSGSFEVKEYAFPAFTQPWTWTMAPTIKQRLYYQKCGNCPEWEAWYWVPAVRDLSQWTVKMRFGCGAQTQAATGIPRCGCTSGL